MERVEGEYIHQALRPIRLIALGQVVLPIWRNVGRLVSSTIGTTVLGVPLEGGARYGYLIVTTLLWVVAGIGLWRQSKRAWALSLALYGWVIANLLVLAGIVMFGGSELFPMTPPALVVAILGVLVVALVLVARFLYRQRDAFD